ncbi:MAG: DDE-type integrase/transposase/recombinase, partial [Gammaproteobacteria bacterium]|nr:DDE-type integrase/transposase/recombinase [Gammaproteobacteria bacterium]
MSKEFPHGASLTSDVQPYKQVRKYLKFREGCLYKDDKLVAPAPLRQQVLKQAHIGHPGIVRMKRLLREVYWWPSINKDAERLVRYCEACQRSAKSRPATPMPETRIPTPEKPAVQYALDICGPFHNGRSLVVLIDCFTRYPEILDTKDTTSGRVIRWMKDLFSRYGNPEGIVSDNGPQFTSAEFENFLTDKDI